MSIVLTRYGKMRIIEADQVVSRSLALYGEWAWDELKLLEQLTAPGFCVLDVGAFVGTHTIAFSNFVGSKGKVYSFEPRKEIYSILSENISINHCSNVTLCNIGLDENVQKLNLPLIDIKQPENFGGLSLLNEPKISNRDAYEIEISTIDSLAIEKIDLIKLDVEGMERRVLNGSVNSISRHQPIIFCECNSLNAGKELLEFCLQQQYKVYGFLTSAYNPKNFHGINENIFGEAKELSLLMIPAKKLEATLSIITVDRLLPIYTLEDLVLPLLHKPQYAYEVLSNTATSLGLSINFPSPLVGMRDSEITNLTSENALLHSEIMRIKNTASWQITKPLRLIQSVTRQLIFGSKKEQD